MGLIQEGAIIYLGLLDAVMGGTFSIAAKNCGHGHSQPWVGRNLNYASKR